MNSTEESIAGAAAIHLWLTQPRCLPVATVNIASNEALGYADIASNDFALKENQLNGRASC